MFSCAYSLCTRYIEWSGCDMIKDTSDSGIVAYIRDASTNGLTALVKKVVLCISMKFLVLMFVRRFGLKNVNKMASDMSTILRLRKG